MTRILKSLFLAGLFLLGNLGLECRAYQVITESGKELKWAEPSMSYRINTSTTTAGSAVQSAAATWTSVGSSDFVFSYAGSTSKAWGDNDDLNVVDFGALDDPDTLALTLYWYNPGTGEILENDIRFNTDFKWGIDGSASAFDVQSIAAHELGHCLGLDDLYGSSDTEKTMYFSAAAGETKKRSLDSDDIAGIAYLYPSITIESSLTVSLEPEAAVTAGAQWRVDGGTWRSSGETAEGISAGSHLVEFSDIDGWTSPESKVVDVDSGEDKSITATYLDKPDLTISVVKDGSENKKDFPQFRVTRTNSDNAKKLVVTYSVDPSAEDSATMGEDYKKLKGKVVIRAKSNDAYITVKTKDDKVIESSQESVTIILTSGQSSNTESQTATAYIYDND